MTKENERKQGQHLPTAEINTKDRMKLVACGMTELVVFGNDGYNKKTIKEMR